MKANKYIKIAGPFKVSSISQDGRGVRLEVYPAFPEYNLSAKEIERGQAKHNIDPGWVEEPRWAIQRILRENGGGPGIFTAMGTAQQLEDFLNQCYSPEAVKEWHETLEKALEKVKKADAERMERAMARAKKKLEKKKEVIYR